MKTIAHISDLHFGTEKPELMEGLRSDLAHTRPSLVVVSGDLTQRARLEQFKAARAYLAALPAPRLVVPGNHDIPLFDISRRFLAPLTRYCRFIDENPNPVYDDGELCVIGVNTARSLTWKQGRISLAQIEAVQAQLTRTRAHFKAVVTHHPFIPPPLPDSGQPGIDLVGRGVKAMAVLDAGGVDLLLAGHLHHGYSGDTRTQYPAARRAIVAVQAGTAISGRVRSDPNGYNLITLESDAITVEIRRWQKGAFATGRKMTYRRSALGWEERPE